MLYMNQNPQIFLFSIELFKLQGGDRKIKEEEIMCRACLEGSLDYICRYILFK